MVEDSVSKLSAEAQVKGAGISQASHQWASLKRGTRASELSEKSNRMEDRKAKIPDSIFSVVLLGPGLPYPVHQFPHF